MTMPAEHVSIQIPRLLGLARGVGVADRLLGQIERCLVFRQTLARPLDEADKLLSNQVMPEPAFGRGCQMSEIIADGGMDAQRAVGFAENEMPAHERRDNLAQSRGIEGCQGTAGPPFFLVEPGLHRMSPSTLCLMANRCSAR